MTADNVRIACVGDSITWGFTLLKPWKHSYPALLREMLGQGYDVRNFGYNDAVARFDADTPYVSKRVYRKSKEWEPDIVLLMLGTNDTKRRNWDPVIFRRDYGKLVDSYLSLPSAPKVVLMAPIRLWRTIGDLPLLGLYPETLEEGIRPAIRSIAEEKGLPLIDHKDTITDRKLCLDGVHPQIIGTRLLAEKVFQSLKDLGLVCLSSKES